MRRAIIGILAHVDAGKTTLTEGMLFLAGKIARRGRVDHGDTFLDNFELERKRGITIFSKQADFNAYDLPVTILDTPGHIDFSAEMERTLQVLDAAVLVVSAADGVDGHTRTLVRLLKKYRIPYFIFVNKMDLPGMDRGKVFKEIRKEIGTNVVDFSGTYRDESWKEEIALLDEEMLSYYMENGEIEEDRFPELFEMRKLIPCYFGSALNMEGIESLLLGMNEMIMEKKAPEKFGARVYKISRDEKGVRLTHMKITGGTLRVKEVISHADWSEKADQIRIYSGNKYVMKEEVCAGELCTVIGLSKTLPGMGLGFEEEGMPPVLLPALSYQVLFPKTVDAHSMLKNLQLLEEEEPELRVVFKEAFQEIHVQLMGEIQLEILKSLILERFQIPVSFGEGSIVYQETIKKPVEGIGHFEPLRHYAEVHLLMEPAERGTGLSFHTSCRTDDLAENWQRLILTHLEEKVFPGVLTGSPITDMKITLIAGRAHPKHTEGGDFRQASYRAVRNGLMKAESMLLEPYYKYRIEVPNECTGRVMTDMQKMSGSCELSEQKEGHSVLIGSVPVSSMRGYTKELHAFSHGMGRISLELSGYGECHNPEEVAEQIGYQAEHDTENPADSVFCANGTGFIVKWDHVKEYAHVETEKWQLQPQNTSFSEQEWRRKPVSYGTDEELMEIFRKTYGESKRDRQRFSAPKVIEAVKNPGDPKYLKKPETEKKKKFLLVDGYNIIFSWEELNLLSRDNLDAARNELMNRLCNYQGYTKEEVILVFDAYRVKGHGEEVFDYHNIHVVFTKEAETADMYIEKTTHEIGRKAEVRVASSDGLEQIIILGQGGLRMPAKELKEEILRVEKEIREHLS